jgi:predicted NUDIX family NTP pyrophosphohydrolase
MPKRSAGILLYRRTPAGLEVLLGHSGGPYYAGRDVGAWSVPKGEYGDDETAFEAAHREFTEELGLPVPAGEPVPLGDVTQRNAKIVTVWAIEADLDPATITPGLFSMQWPPKSGQFEEFPEIDRVAWLSLDQAREWMITGQQPLLDRLPAS